MEGRGEDGRGFVGRGLGQAHDATHLIQLTRNLADHGVFVPFKHMFGDDCALPIVQVFNAAPAFGWPQPNSVRLISVGLLLMVIGNALPKSRPGVFIGIRTPWTITDTDNWIATHRLGGQLTMLAGLVIALSAVLPIDPQWRVVLFFGCLAGMVVPPLIYSWWFWHRKKQASALMEPSPMRRD